MPLKGSGNHADCRWCGRRFSLRPSYQASGTKFCSWECRQSAKTDPLKKGFVKIKGKLLPEFYEGRKIDYKARYPSVSINRITTKIHVLVWEKFNGRKVPKGLHVHHIDGDVTNFEITNLEVLSSTDHRRKHAGWLMSVGQWVKRPCSACHTLLPLDKFYESVSSCKECWRKKTNKRKELIRKLKKHES